MVDHVPSFKCVSTSLNKSAPSAGRSLARSAQIGSVTLNRDLRSDLCYAQRPSRTVIYESS